MCDHISESDPCIPFRDELLPGHYELLEKYARLLIEIGVNVTANEDLIIEAPADAAELVRLCTKIAFERKVHDVIVLYTDAYVDLERIRSLPADQLKEVPSWQIEARRQALRQGASSLLIKSTYPYLYKDCPVDKMNAYQEFSNNLRNVIRASIAQDGTKWCIASYPNALWAKTLYPELPKDMAMQKMLDLFFKICRIRKGEDSVQSWIDHINDERKIAWKLDSFHLDRLLFRNSLGTDLEVGLHPNAVFAISDRLFSRKDYCWNIPTEEIATSPDKYRVNGTVVASRPLELGGTIVEGMRFTFQEGKVVRFHADKNPEVLQHILDHVDGSRYLGEVALVSDDTPISQSGKLFYNTLFDENASCHLALGKGFALSVKSADPADIATWEPVHLNYSAVHIDFMFGTSDMSVTGYDKTGKEYPIFRDGCFVV